MEYHTLGSMSKSDIVLCYMDGLADQDLLDDIRRKLSEIHVEALTMAQESLAEALVPHKWLNPFPKVRYTERPDAASSNILEGKVILMIDNSPSVLILPTSFLTSYRRHRTIICHRLPEAICASYAFWCFS